MLPKECTHLDRISGEFQCWEHSPVEGHIMIRLVYSFACFDSELYYLATYKLKHIFLFDIILSSHTEDRRAIQ